MCWIEQRLAHCAEMATLKAELHKAEQAAGVTHPAAANAAGLQDTIDDLSSQLLEQRHQSRRSKCSLESQVKGLEAELKYYKECHER